MQLLCCAIWIRCGKAYGTLLLNQSCELHAVQGQGHRNLSEQHQRHLSPTLSMTRLLASWQSDRKKCDYRWPMASFLPSLLRHWLEVVVRTATSTMSFLLKDASKQFDGSARVRFWTTMGNVAPSTAGWNALTKGPFKRKHAPRLYDCFLLVKKTTKRFAKQEIYAQ